MAYQGIRLQPDNSLLVMSSLNLDTISPKRCPSTTFPSEYLTATTILLYALAL